MSDTTSLPFESNNRKSLPLTIESLTDQNWLFIKHFLETGNLKKAYALAGYEVSNKSGCYDIFRRLKPIIEEIVNTELSAKLKFSEDLQKALALPLVSKESLTVSEWLRIRKFAKSLVPEMEQPKQQLSVLVFNRYPDKQGDKKRLEVTNPIPDITLTDVIDIQQIPNSEA